MTLFSIAHAAPVAAGATPQAGSMNSSLLMLLIFGAFIYFILWRPQSKRQKQHRDLISNLKTDDEVMTAGGFVGRLTKVEELFFDLQIAENVIIKIQRNAISGLLPKGTVKF